MMTLARKTIYGMMTMIIVALFTGCGGGGGGGSAGIAYTGSTAPATLTQSNSGTLISGSYLGGNSGVIMGGVTASLTNDSTGTHRPRGIMLSQALTKFVRHSNINGLLSETDVNAAVTNIPASTLNGTCGGTVTTSGTYNDVNGDLSLSASFSGYCEDETTLNGSMSITGQAVADAQSNINISNIAITLSNLTVSYTGDSFTADGSMTIAPQQGFTYIDTNVVLTLTMLFKDNTTSKVYKLENFQASVTSTIGASSYDDISISGRYYDPDEGYIDLSTPATLRANLGDEWPSSGSLRATGNNCSATITALSNTAYQLDVDTDNNGSADYTETGLWSAL